MEVVGIDESKVDGLVWHQGLSSWTPLDENRMFQTNQKRLFFDERYLPPSEQELLDALPKTRRLYPHDNNTGGFYVALLRHRGCDT